MCVDIAHAIAAAFVRDTKLSAVDERQQQTGELRKEEEEEEEQEEEEREKEE